MLHSPLLSQNLLYEFMFSKIGKCVSMVAKNISCKKLDAIFVADLVNFDYDIPGTASQANLQKGRIGGVWVLQTVNHCPDVYINPGEQSLWACLKPVSNWYNRFFGSYG